MGRGVLFIIKRGSSFSLVPKWGLVHAKAQVAIERSPYSTCHSDFGQNLAPTLRDSDQSRNDKCALACTGVLAP